VFENECKLECKAASFHLERPLAKLFLKSLDSDTRDGNFKGKTLFINLEYMLCMVGLRIQIFTCYLFVS